MNCPLNSNHSMKLKEEIKNTGAQIWYCPICKQYFWVYGVETKPIEPYIISNPPEGYRQVLNLYVDPVSGKLIVRWDDEAL